jgi:hypothetical protein
MTGTDPAAYGGEGGIRTHDRIAPMPIFKSDHLHARGTYSHANANISHLINVSPKLRFSRFQQQVQLECNLETGFAAQFLRWNWLWITMWITVNSIIAIHENHTDDD